MIRTALLIVLLLAGCAATRVETTHGDAFREAMANQILNPEASSNVTPVTGMDGQSAQVVLKTYRIDSAKTAPAASAFVMTPMSLGTGQ